MRFDTPVGLPLEATFDAGRLTSDGGLPWLAEAERKGEPAFNPVLRGLAAELVRSP